jgi:hypothetical protein
MGAYVRNASHLQQALHGTVLTVLTVENRVDNIDPLPDNTLAFKAQQALAPDRGNGSPAILGIGFPLAGGQQGVILAGVQNPVAVPGDAHGEDIIFFMVHMVQNGLRGTQGNCVFGTSTAEQDANIHFFHGRSSFFMKFSLSIYLQISCGNL